MDNQTYEFDFDTYIEKLMAAMEMDQARPEIAEAVKEQLTKQLAQLIGETVGGALNDAQWLALGEEHPEAEELGDLLSIAMEEYPEVGGILIEALNNFWAEMTSAYETLKIA